jgi:uncharacterized membrane protein YkvA (DUF1232 family)
MNDQFDNKANPADKSWFTTPLSARGWPTWIVYIFGLIGILYILNPTAGILELIPDNFPIIGNLDEAVAFMLIWAGMLEFIEGKKRKKG